MRIHYFMALFIGLLITKLSFGQFNNAVPANLNSANNAYSFETKALTACGNDTLLYTLSKTTFPEAATVNDAVFYNEIAQRYNTTDTITVYGMCYYAYNAPGGSGPVNITLNMHEVAADSLPSTIIASAFDTVPIGSGSPFTDFKRCVTWSTPIVIDRDFYVSLDASGSGSESFGVYKNSGAFNDGAGEILSAVYYDDGSAAAWVKWYLQTGSAWDFDYLLEPIVSYDLSIESQISRDSACTGDLVCIELDSISSLFNSRFLNVNTSASPISDFGDGNTGTGDTVCNVYTTPGNYTVLHTINMTGWTSTCSVSHTDSVMVIAVPTAGFTYVVSNDTVVFTNTSTGGSGGSWDFGGSGSSMAMDTTFVFPSNGAFVVEQIVWNALGCADTVSQTISITVGIEENKLPQLSLYPNPTNGILNIVNSVSVDQFNVSIMDMTGKVLSRQVINGSVNTIDLSSYANGQYLVQIANQSGLRVDRIQIIK